MTEQNNTVDQPSLKFKWVKLRVFQYFRWPLTLCGYRRLFLSLVVGSRWLMYPVERDMYRNIEPAQRVFLERRTHGEQSYIGELLSSWRSRSADDKRRPESRRHRSATKHVKTKRKPHGPGYSLTDLPQREVHEAITEGRRRAQPRMDIWNQCIPMQEHSPGTLVHVRDPRWNEHPAWVLRGIMSSLTDTKSTLGGYPTVRRKTRNKQNADYGNRDYEPSDSTRSHFFHKAI
jgi:hypothetical protein